MTSSSGVDGATGVVLTHDCEANAANTDIVSVNRVYFMSFEIKNELAEFPAGVK